MPPVAHIVQGALVPTVVGWVAAALIVVGGAGIFWGRGSAVEVVGWAVFGVAFCAAAAVIAMTALLPTSARITVRLAAPTGGALTSPVGVVVCGRDAASGAPTAAPDGSNVLVVLVDGREVSTERSGSFALQLSPGAHRLRVELVDAGHRVFSPRVFAETTLTVTSSGPLAASGNEPATTRLLCQTGS
jgi:hypothetical protein